jgi:hypothetical protein
MKKFMKNLPFSEVNLSGPAQNAAHSVPTGNSVLVMERPLSPNPSGKPAPNAVRIIPLTFRCVSLMAPDC